MNEARESFGREQRRLEYFHRKTISRPKYKSIVPIKHGRNRAANRLAMRKVGLLISLNSNQFLQMMREKAKMKGLENEANEANA